MHGGDGVYQVAPASPSQLKKRSALNPGVHTTLPPAASDARTAAISPWNVKQRHDVEAAVAGGQRQDRSTGRPCGAVTQPSPRPRTRRSCSTRPHDVAAEAGRSATPTSRPRPRKHRRDLALTASDRCLNIMPLFTSTG